MKYVAVITFLTILFNCFFFGVFMLIRSDEYDIESIRYNIYHGFCFSLVILSFPILLSVMLFRIFLKKFSRPENLLLRNLIQICLITLLIQCGLLCWAMMDMQFFDFNYEYTIKNIVASYSENYADYFLTSILIPVSIIFLDRRYTMYNSRKNRPA